MSVKILAFPIFRRYWLYHSWTTEAAEAAQALLLKDWRKGVNLEEKLSLLGKQVSSKVSGMVYPSPGGWSAGEGP